MRDINEPDDTDAPLTREQHKERLRVGTHEQVAMNEDGGCTMTLLEPITLGKKTITELRFRRAKMKDIRAASHGANDVETMAIMISCLTGQALLVLDELDPQDFIVCVEIAGFLGQPRRPTGTRS